MVPQVGLGHKRSAALFNDLVRKASPAMVFAFSEDREPTAFFIVVLSKVVALIFCVAIALRAVGVLSTDPIAEIKHWLPWLGRVRIRCNATIRSPRWR